MIRRLLLLLVLAAGPLSAQEPVLSKSVRALPGINPTPFLQYEDPTARQVEISGIWNLWSNRVPLTRQGEVWQLDVRTLNLKPGRHEYKFIVNGVWEPGENRAFYIDDNGVLIRPPNVVVKALHEAPNEILVFLNRVLKGNENIRISLESGIPVKEVLVSTGKEEGRSRGHMITAGTLTFVFDPSAYGITVKPTDVIGVAGNFNYWNGSGGPNGLWQLRDEDGDGIWQLSMTLDGLRKASSEPDFLFRFVINGSQWLTVPPDAPNAVADSSGNRNYRIDPGATGSSVLKVITAEPIPVDTLQVLVIEGLADRKAWHQVTPGAIMSRYVSDKALGVTLNREQNATTYRLFAPRATSVHLNLFDTPEFEVHKPEHQRLTPRERYPMWKDEADGVWEITLLGLDIGAYYSFTIDGPAGRGEGFNRDAFVSDPYGLASAHAENNTIVIDPDATNKWFGGWSNQTFRTPDFQDMVIYEAHLRDLTMHPSSLVPAHLRGKYAGLLATVGTGTGLDHLKDMGVNMIEFLPMQEFNNGVGEYNWGYTTVHYFAPEASFGREPLKGSQYYEFKTMVNELHRLGFGVMIDVVYNHVGWPNLFAHIDRKYFFRLTPDYDYLSFSGVGNDFKSESPMARKFIVENIKFLVREFKIDGFRWDLAELIDMDTLMEAKREAEKISPRVIMVSEPWSFRGNHKEQLRGTGWAAWNNDFRYAGKDFARGRANRDTMKKVIAGSTELWTANPLQSVNYVESHDDMALADVLSSRPDKDGRHLNEFDAQMNRLAATLVFTSLGIPMINEGQEFMRSKRGISNTYNRGDGVNAIRWTDRERPIAAETMAYYRGLIQLRSSEQGRAFRVKTTPPPGYLDWIEPPNEKHLGFVINAPRIHPGHGFVVLLNSDDQPATFRVDLPAGNWRVIGDGNKIEMDGLDNYETITGPRTLTIRVPDVRALIMMDGF
jgi:pullulanase/glycogen debranching enzyme